MSNKKLFNIKEFYRRIQSSDNSHIVFDKEDYLVESPEGENDFSLLMEGKLDFDTHWGKVGYPYNMALKMENMKNITLDFSGSTLTFQGLVQPIRISNCRNIIIKNLIIDFERSPFSTGTILEVNDRGSLIRVADEFPVRGGEPVWAYMDYDTQKDRMGLLWKFRNMPPLELIAPQTVFLGGETRFTPGNKIIMRHVGNYRPGINIIDSDTVRFENLTIYNNPGMGVVGHYSRDISFDNLKVIPKNDALMSTTTDATHFISCHGKLEFDNCQFEGMGDDAVNVHGFFHSITEIPDERTVKFTIHNENGTQDQIFDAPSPGDTVEFSKAVDLFPFQDNEVESVKMNPEKWEGEVRFKNKLEGISVDDLFTSSNDLPYLRFSDCVVTKIRARAALIQTRGALVENCHISKCTGSGIHIDTATGWWESIGTRDIIIRNNKIEECGYGDGTYNNAAGIAVLTECEENRAGVHKNILLEKNEIIGCGYSGIYCASVDGLSINGNKITDCSIAIEVECCENVTLSDNETGDQKVLINEKTTGPKKLNSEGPV